MPQSRLRIRGFLVLGGIAVLFSGLFVATRAIALAEARRQLAPYRLVLAASGLSTQLTPTHWRVGYDTYDGYCCSGCYLAISFLGATVDKPECGITKLDKELRGLGKLCASPNPLNQELPFLTAQAQVEWHIERTVTKTSDEKLLVVPRHTMLNFRETEKGGSVPPGLVLCHSDAHPVEAALLKPHSIVRLRFQVPPPESRLRETWWYELL